MNFCRVGFDGLAAWTFRVREIAIQDFTPQPATCCDWSKSFCWPGSDFLNS